MTQEQQNLILNNTKLVYFVVHKLFGKATEDNVSIGNLGLCKAALKFDPSKNIAFCTYAHWVIKNELLMSLRSNKLERSSTVLSLDTPVIDDKPMQDLVVDTSETSFELLLQQERAAKLKRALKKLTPSYRQAITLRFGLFGEAERSIEEIATIMKLPKRQVSSLIQRAKNRIRTLMYAYIREDN